MHNEQTLEIRFTINGKEHRLSTQNEHFMIGIAEDSNEKGVLRFLLKHHPSREVKIALASNMASDEDIVAELALDEWDDVKYRALRHPKQKKFILEDFAKHEFWGDRYAVAESPQTPEEVLKVLIFDEKMYVAEKAIEHPNMKDVAKLEQVLAESSENRVKKAARKKLEQLKAV